MNGYINPGAPCLVTRLREDHCMAFAALCVLQGSDFRHQSFCSGDKRVGTTYFSSNTDTQSPCRLATCDGLGYTSTCSTRETLHVQLDLELQLNHYLSLYLLNYLPLLSYSPNYSPA